LADSPGYGAGCRRLWLEVAETAGFTANTATYIENGADAKQSTTDPPKTELEAAGIELSNVLVLPKQVRIQI
jgi:hypothetical protein